MDRDGTRNLAKRQKSGKRITTANRSHNQQKVRTHSGKKEKHQEIVMQIDENTKQRRMTTLYMAEMNQKEKIEDDTHMQVDFSKKH